MSMYPVFSRSDVGLKITLDLAKAETHALEIGRGNVEGVPERKACLTSATYGGQKMYAVVPQTTTALAFQMAETGDTLWTVEVRVYGPSNGQKAQKAEAAKKLTEPLELVTD